MKVSRGIISSFLAKYLQIDEHEALKTVLASVIFGCIIGAYSILRSLKTSIFLGFVGREFEPMAKIVGILITVPTMMIHAYIIDRFKKHQVVYLFLAFYTVVALVFALVFTHPVYGVPNTNVDPYRLTGWAFEIFMDLFQALVVGTFWSFINSIYSPKNAEKSYGFIVAGSRIGGIITPTISWILFEFFSFSKTANIAGLTAASALLLAYAVYSIYRIKRVIPQTHMLGYEAAHAADEKDESVRKSSNTFEGLKLMLTEPYVLGIFGLVFSFEVINIIFDYQMHILMSIETNNDIGAMSSFMLMYTGTFQFMSFIFSIFGTTAILKRLGIQYSLIVVPILTMGLALVPVFYPKLMAIFIVMVLLRALNYGFSHPLREMLFIPTTKDIRFKSKAWMESFGRTFSKATGSSLNWVAISNVPYMCIMLESCFSFALAILWAFIALAVGKKYIDAVRDNAVIGRKK